METTISRVQGLKAVETAMLFRVWESGEENGNYLVVWGLEVGSRGV